MIIYLLKINYSYIFMKNQEFSIMEKLLRLKKLNNLLEDRLIRPKEFEIEQYKILKS